GEGRGCRDNDDDVDLQPNHLGCKFSKPLCAALRIPTLYNDVLPLNVSEFAETLEQRVIKCLISVCDKRDPPTLARLLRARRERPRSCRAAKQADELPPS